MLNQADLPIKRAVIVGAGIGGLCAAIGLWQIGVEIAVYEQAGRLDPVGAGLTLWANAIKALRKLGLADKVIAAGSKIQRGRVYTAGGRILARNEPGELEQRYGEPTIAIHRADLHHILLGALPADRVHLGTACIGFEQAEDHVIVRFTNGQTDQADLLVGADGIHSAIRKQLFPDIKLRYSGYTAWRGVVVTEDEMVLGTTSESWGCGARFGIVPIDRQRVYWFATANTPAGLTQTAAEHKERLRQAFKGWHEPIERLIEATPAEAILHNDIYDIKPMTGWSQGRVTLLGDAAHPATPNMGQGACMAIESSLVLAGCLSQERHVNAALRCYEAERMPRTAWVTDQSWRIGRIGQLENPLACAMRNFVISITPAGVLKKQVEQVVGYELK